MGGFGVPEEKQKSNSDASSTPANVQIYDRPEKKGLSPAIIALIAVALIILAVVLYRAFVR